MNYRCLVTGLAFLISVTLIGVGLALEITPALITGILLIGIAGAAYVIWLFNPSRARPLAAANMQPRIVIRV